MHGARSVPRGRTENPYADTVFVREVAAWDRFEV